MTSKAGKMMFGQTTHSQLFITLVLVPPIVLYLITFLSEKELRVQGKEDSLVEYLGAFCLLTAAALFFISFKRRRNVFYLLFGVVFLFGFLEEISYGQRILGFSTPSFFLEHNIQNEFNLHNLQWFMRQEESGVEKGFVDTLLNMDRLFSLFGFGYCIFIPLLCYLSTRAAKLVERIRLPLVPLAIGIMLALNYGLSKYLAVLHPLVLGETEIKETVSEYLFALFAVFELSLIHSTGRGRVGLVLPEMNEPCAEVSGRATPDG